MDTSGLFIYSSINTSCFLQALSNSVWALAHIRAKVAELDAVAGREGAVVGFLHGVAACAINMLRSLNTRMDLTNLHTCMIEAEKKFSCQVGLVFSLIAFLHHPYEMCSWLT